MTPVEDRGGLFVDPTIVGAKRWAEATDPFVETVKQRDLVPLRIPDVRDR